MHNNLFLVQLLVLCLRSTNTAICSTMIWRKNHCLSVAGTPMSHGEQEILVMFVDGLPLVSCNQR